MTNQPKLIQLCFSPIHTWTDRDGFEDSSGGSLFGLDSIGLVWKLDNDWKLWDVGELKEPEEVDDRQEAE